MKNIKDSNIVKAICYSLVPMLVLIIILNACSLIYYANYEEDFEDDRNSYVDTQRFADNYFYAIQRAIYISNNEKKLIEKNTQRKRKRGKRSNSIQFL